MAFNPNAVQLSQEQILQQVYNPADNTLKVDAYVQVDTINADLTVDIKAASGDNISITNPSGTNPILPNADGSINTNSAVTGAVTVSGTVNTNLNGLNIFQTSQYTVGTSAVQLTPIPLSTRSSISIKAIISSGNIIYIGNSSSITTSTGYGLFNGDSLQMDLTPSDAIWAISTAANQTLNVLEIGS